MATSAEKLHAEIARLDEDEDAREEVHARIARLLRKSPELINQPAPPEFPYPPLVTAVLVRDEELVDLLLSHGADWQVRVTMDPTADCFTTTDRAAAQDQTLLHIAAAVGHPDLIELFIEKGTDVNARDGNGDTPLFVAASGD